MGCYSTNDMPLQKAHITLQMNDELPVLHVITTQRIVDNLSGAYDSMTSTTPNNKFKISNEKKYSIKLHVS